MQLKMSQNSLFAILLRSPWWISFAVVLVIVLLGKIIASGDYFSYAVALTLPFIIIGSIAAWKQRDEPSQARIEETVEAVSAMSWREFSERMEKAFERDGFKVSRTNGAADFVLEKEGRTSLVCCKRWKAASQGVEPLRELEAARIRIAHINGCLPCSEARPEDMAAQGIDEAFYADVDDPARRGRYSGREALAIGFAERFAAGKGSFDAEFWQDLTSAFTPGEIVELSTCVAKWLAIGRINAVLDMELSCPITIPQRGAAR